MQIVGFSFFKNFCLRLYLSGLCESKELTQTLINTKQ